MITKKNVKIIECTNGQLYSDNKKGTFMKRKAYDEYKGFFTEQYVEYSV